jgi:hypothetical protein
MMLLSEQIQQVDTEFNHLRASHENKNAIEETEAIIQLLEPISDDISHQLMSRTVLRSLPGQFALPELTDHEQALAMTINDEFKTFYKFWCEENYRVRQNDRLEPLRTAVASLLSTMKATSQDGRRRWIQHLDSQFAITPVELASVKDIDKYKDDIGRYTAIRDSFNELSGKATFSIEDVNNLQSMASQLSSLRKAIDTTNVPTNVRRFFEQLNSGPNPLSLLTPEIRKWLDENGATDDLAVIRRRSLRS